MTKKLTYTGPYVIDSLMNQNDQFQHPRTKKIYKYSKHHRCLFYRAETTTPKWIKSDALFNSLIKEPLWSFTPSRYTSDEMRSMLLKGKMMRRSTWYENVYIKFDHEAMQVMTHSPTSGLKPIPTDTTEHDLYNDWEEYYEYCV